jgi:hypothetical protein
VLISLGNVEICYLRCLKVERYLYYSKESNGRIYSFVW